MNIKKLLISAAVLASCVSLSACGGNSSSEGPAGGSQNGPTTARTIKVAVGKESAEFYTKVLADYAANTPGFIHKIEVVAADTGAAADNVISDPEAAADIFTVAHDNIGKLIEANCVLPLTNEALVAQVEGDNPQSFLDVIYSKLDGVDYVYAAPYISQALVLMYNKSKVTAEQAKTFEGLMEAAVANKSEAVSVTGTDGFNFSFVTLSRKASDGSTTAKLYKDGVKNDCYFQGDDTVAAVRWAQDFFGSDNGGHFPSSAGWESDAMNNKVISVIGGAWQFKAFEDAVGSTNAGYTVLPTFTVDADDVEGTSIPEGTKFQAGSFVDCKCLMLNAYSDEDMYDTYCDIITYLSSKDIQNKSFKEANNLPAYVGATEYIETIKDTITENQYQGACAQNGMAAHGIAQPFVNSILNTYYYSKGAPEVFLNIVNNTDSAYTTLDQVRQGLYRVEHIWQKGKEPAAADIPASLPQDI
ncbi:MAG: extracellular solute-binding protein [Erysipelotrichaceae bacterium]|nr:extracellular solute-binding protein [Erysipelotrichaceae bacterium]